MEAQTKTKLLYLLFISNNNDLINKAVPEIAPPLPVPILSST